MSISLIKFEAIEARIASYSCPRGVAGRLHVLRLKRHFRPHCRLHSSAIGTVREWEKHSHIFGGSGLESFLPGELLRQPKRGTEQAANSSTTSVQEEVLAIDRIEAKSSPLTPTRERAKIDRPLPRTSRAF